MRANQCDRCGDLYKKTNYSKYRLVTYSDCKSRCQRSVDLCPQCLDELDKWFNKMVIRGGKKEHD